MSEEIRCPACGSPDWFCWDEQVFDYEDKDGYIYMFPVGYLRCRQCGKTYINEDPAVKGMTRLEDTD